MGNDTVQAVIVGTGGYNNQLPVRLWQIPCQKDRIQHIGNNQVSHNSINIKGHVGIDLLINRCIPCFLIKDIFHNVLSSVTCFFVHQGIVVRKEGSEFIRSMR